MIEKKTSEQWVEGYTGLIVLDPDGWDRSNFKYSFFEEQITHEEFRNRLSRSTVSLLASPVREE